MVIVLISCLQAGQAAPNNLKITDIERVMDRFFSFHIENRELNPTIVRRLVKLYIEQFDPDKSYLLESEVLPYLQLSDADAMEILSHIQAGDYSDFARLNQLFQKAVIRFQENRQALAASLSVQGGDQFSVAGGGHSNYARNYRAIVARQKDHMIRFFNYHKARTQLNDTDRKAKVFALFDKKVRRSENNILYLEGSGKKMSSDQIEHLVALRILKAFAKSLDTHTSFFSPEEAHDLRLNLEKQFEGVGIVLSEGIDGVMIADLIEGSPAQESGTIQVNDLLVEIDGNSIEPMQFNEILDLLKKKDKRSISLGFKRRGSENGKEEFFRVELTKKPITMQEERIVSSYVRREDGIIGKITLHSFYESGGGQSSEKDIKEAIRSFREQGNLVGLVLDLRENSGGFLSQAVKVAGLFLTNGVVVISKYGRGEIHYLRNIVSRSFYNGPLVILTSKMSASAAEIVAQTLQDYGVALVVGDERTFGKGSIQYQTITDEKADYFFKITVGRYYTVSGRTPQIEGVIPDIILPGKYAPYKIGERYLEFALSADHASPAFIDPLSDLDERTKQAFEKRYIPNLQRVVHYWKKMVPALKQNSAARIAQNSEYREMLNKQAEARVNELPVNTIDDHIQAGLDDYQMDEAVQIVSDMIEIQAQQGSPVALLPTGSEGE